MSFETMNDALETLTEYSQQVVRLYENKAATARDEVVASVLYRAIDQELTLQRGALQAAQRLSAKVESARFKWHDRRLLFKALNDCRDDPVRSIDDAVDLIVTCEKGLTDYLRALEENTNSDEVSSFLHQLRDRRVQDGRAMVWQAQRGMA